VAGEGALIRRNKAAYGGGVQVEVNIAACRE